MSKEDDITRNDIPQVEELKAAILKQLDSGRARSFKTVQKDVSSELNISAEQRKYKIKGSKTTLLENRMEKARSELKADGLIEYPARGKMKITASSNKPNQSSQATEETLILGKEKSAVVKEAAGEAPIISPLDPQPPNPANANTTTPITVAPATATASPMVSGEATTSSNKGEKYRKYIPLALVLIGILLCIANFGLPGAILGGAGLFIKTKDAKNDSAENPAAPKTTLWAGIASILIGLVLAISSCTGSSTNASTNQNETTTPAAVTSQEETRKTAEGVLSFKITAKDWPNKNTPVQVSIEGTTSSGTSVSDHYEALVDTVYALEYGAGKYTMTVAQGSLTCDGIPFTISPSTCDFDGIKDRLVTLSLSKDEEALLAAQEEEKRIAAEEAARAKEEADAAARIEAEKKAAEEAAAAAAAAAAVAPAVETPAATGGSSSSGSYIGNVNTLKFHVPSCSTLPKESNRIYFSSRSEAINSGYNPCKRCNP